MRMFLAPDELRPFVVDWPDVAAPQLNETDERALAIAQACHGQPRAIGAGAGARTDQNPVALRRAEEVQADLGIDERPFAHVDDLADAARKIRRLHRLQ